MDINKNEFFYEINDKGNIKINFATYFSYAKINQIADLFNTKLNMNIDPDDMRSYLTNVGFLSQAQSDIVKSVFNTEFLLKDKYTDEFIKHDIDKAIKEYGITDNELYAGFILPDGRMLDFSDGLNWRSIDHREIEECITDCGKGPADGLIQFMNYGCIRICGKDKIDISRPLTDAQKNTLKSYASYNKEFIVDISDIDGGFMQTLQYDFPIHISRIFNDVDNFFKGLEVSDSFELEKEESEMEF